MVFLQGGTRRCKVANYDFQNRSKQKKKKKCNCRERGRAGGGGGMNCAAFPQETSFTSAALINTQP